MALQKPLVFDTSRGVPRVLDPVDGLHLPGDLKLDGKVGFYGGAPAVQPTVAGSWAQTLDDLTKALAALGLIVDLRPPGWNTGINSLSSASAVGPYEPGRLIIGSITGWAALDQPAKVPGVIQVPTSHAGLQEINPANGLLIEGLAYSPVLSYGPTAPPTPAQAAALWFDTTTSTLKVFSGSAWQEAAPGQVSQLVATLKTAGPGSLLVADGAGGVTVVSAGVGAAGRSLVVDASGKAFFIELITTGVTPPWANGASAFAPLPAGGGRPTGLGQALWCNPALNAETIGFWDEASHQWKSVYVNNPVLNQLAELRSQLVDGDLLTVSGNAVVRLPLGSPGAALTVDATGVAWHERFSAGTSRPAAAVDGDLWLDHSTDTVWLRENGRWLDVNRVQRYVDVNGSGGAVLPGQALIHAAPNWRLASSAAAAGSFVAVALAAAGAGQSVAAAVEGVVALSEAEWSAVIDSAEPHAPGTGLSPGRTYYVSSLTPGLLTTKPSGGADMPIGTALSGTQLLLRHGMPPGVTIPARVNIGVTPPAGSVGALWYSSQNGSLYVFYDDGTSQQWVSVGGGSIAAAGLPAALAAGGGGGRIGQREVADLAAIDWVSDPLAAAIQITYSDGSTDSMRIRGAGGTTVTMADSHTLVIDAGGGKQVPSSGASGPGGGGGTGGMPAVIDGGNFTTGAAVTP
ncbi:MAG: hypothetical protein LW834_07030 [Cyanobium sp. 49614_E6]|jgi:hypothetical protein|nr:hypothetical protein [Cyanobium sp. 49614_E6]